MDHSQKGTLRNAVLMLAAIGLTVALVLPAAAAHRPGATVYKAELTSVADNEPGANGGATIVQKGAEIRVNLRAGGLFNGTHLAHVHGLVGANNTCPTASDDVNDDGFVDLAEGAGDYGPILLDLHPSQGTQFAFSRTFSETLDPLGVNPTPNGTPLDEIGPLDQFHIVVHGVDVDGDGDLDGQKDVNNDGMIGGTDNPVLNLTEAAFELSMPALCGDIVKMSN